MLKRASDVIACLVGELRGDIKMDGMSLGLLCVGRITERLDEL